MKKLIFCAKTLIISSLFAGSVAFAADAPPKEAICKSCHGVGGAAPIAPNYPKLNGQNKAYLVSALKAYKAGERKGPLAIAMTAQASSLSDADIDALAAYYASVK